MTDYEKLKGIIDEVDVLVRNCATASKPDFKAWKTTAARFLIKMYGEDSFEYKSFQNTCFSPNV